MMPQGFQPSLTASATELPNQNLLRVYLSSGDPAVTMAVALTIHNDDVTISNQYFELETDFSDGTKVQTRNTDHQNTFAIMPHVEMHKHPGIRNPLALKLQHDEHCAKHRAKGTKFYTTDELIDLIEEDHSLQMEYQLERRHYARKKNGHYRPTVFIAAQQVLGFINPVQNPRWTVKLAALFLLIALPIAMVALIINPSLDFPGIVSQQIPSLTPEMAGFVTILPLVAASSVALGWVLGPRAISWSMFLPLAQSRMLLPKGIPGFGGHLPIFIMLMGAAKITQMTNNFLNRRQDRTSK